MGAAADAIILAGRRLGARGLISAGEGNISVRLDADRLLVTPGGARKDELEPEDLVVVWHGHPDREAVSRNGRRPTSDLAIHLAVHAARPDIGSFAHGAARPARQNRQAQRHVAEDRAEDVIAHPEPCLCGQHLGVTREQRRVEAFRQRRHVERLIGNAVAVAAGVRGRDKMTKSRAARGAQREPCDHINSSAVGP